MRRDVIDLLRSNCFSPGVSSVYFLFVLSFLACSYELIHSSLSLSLSTSLWVPSVMLCGRVKDCTIGLNRPFSSAKKRNSKLNFEAYYHYVVCGRELIDRSARRLSAVRIRDMLVFCVSFHRIVIINWGSVHLRN